MSEHRYDVRTVPYLYDHRLNPDTATAREIVAAAVKVGKALTKESHRPEKPAGVPRMSVRTADEPEQLRLA